MPRPCAVVPSAMVGRTRASEAKQSHFLNCQGGQVKMTRCDRQEDLTRGHYRPSDAHPVSYRGVLEARVIQ